MSRSVRMWSCSSYSVNSNGFGAHRRKPVVTPRHITAVFRKARVNCGRVKTHNALANASAKPQTETNAAAAPVPALAMHTATTWMTNALTWQNRRIEIALIRLSRGQTSRI